MPRAKKFLIGIDEAGRGPLAGPITFAALAIPRKSAFCLRGTKDSKHVSPKARERLLGVFKAHPRISYFATSVGPRLIDRLGISRVSYIGISRLLRRLSIASRARVFLDGGLKAPPKYCCQTIIKGDELVPVIAAASIVAKVTRDRKMVRLAKKFPDYGLEIHKGYGTKMHFAALKKHKLSSIHRRSFCGNVLYRAPEKA